MTIYQRMLAVFQAAGIEGFLNRYERMEETSLPDKYCAYTVMQDGPALSADDGEAMHASQVYIDLHGKTDVSVELDSLLDALDAAGFCWLPVRHLDGLSASRFIYHKRIIATWYGDPGETGKE